MRLYHRTYRDRAGVKKTCSTWSVRFKVGAKVIDVSLGTRDKRAAELKAAERVKAEELRAAGVETHHEVRDVPIADLVEEYQGELRRRGRSEDHIRKVGRQILVLSKGLRGLVALTPERIRRALARLDVMPKTANYYRVALHGLFAWLIREGRWTVNPVAAVGRARETERSRIRRALTGKELDALLEAAPEHRATVYLIAATTGLRRSELASLTWGDVDLDGNTVTIRASKAKNRKDTVLPLPEGSARRLAETRGHVTPAARVFMAIPGVETLQQDLIAAGIEFETPEGVVDFHALRVTFGTSLARASVPLALAQKLMRHSTPVLTANIYTRLELHDGAAAVAKIDRLVPASKRRRAKR
jgi:integrase/recombinase XerD